MTLHIKRLFSCVIAFVLALSLVPSIALAQTVSAAETVLQSQASNDPLTAHVTLNEVPVVNKDISFTISATGGSGNYQFVPYYLRIYNGSYYGSYIDWSYKHYSPEDTYTFNVTLSGDYRLAGYVMDMTPNEDGRYSTNWAYIDFSVYDPNALTYAQRIQMKNQKVSLVVNECLRQGNKTDYDKALWLHDWVLNNCTYDYTLQYFQSVDLFIDGRGTCEAYHGAYMELLQAAGIECGRVTDNGHVWTSVKINGQWCHIDTTHDDLEYSSATDTDKHLMFGLNDELQSALLAVNNAKIVTKLPSFESTSLENHYLYRTGKILEYSLPFVDDIQNKLDAGEKEFSIPVTKYMPPTTKTVIYGVAAYQLSTLDWDAKKTPILLQVSYSNDALHFKVKPRPTTAGSSVSKTSIKNATVTGVVSKAYTGKKITQKPTVNVNGIKLVLNRDYTLSYKNNTKCGTATMTIKGKGSYTGSKSIKFKIVAHKQPMKVTAVAKSVKASKLKINDVTLSRPLKITKAKGTLTFKNASTSKAAKSIKVNAKTGKITLPQNMKKGTYKLKITVKAAGTSKYAYGSKTVTTTIRVR